MNKELIQKFLDKACWDQQAQYELEDWLNVEKFAELIVKECMKLNRDILCEDDPDYLDKVYKEHFGVEE